MPKETEPPWKMMVNWTEDMQMRYEVPAHDCGELLKQDVMVLKRMRQPHMLTQQLDELLYFISPSDEDTDSQVSFSISCKACQTAMVLCLSFHPYIHFLNQGFLGLSKCACCQVQLPQKYLY